MLTQAEPLGSVCTSGGVGMGFSQHSGVVILCDGSEAQIAYQSCLTQ